MSSRNEAKFEESYDRSTHRSAAHSTVSDPLCPIVQLSESPREPLQNSLSRPAYRPISRISRNFPRISIKVGGRCALRRSATIASILERSRIIGRGDSRSAAAHGIYEYSYESSSRPSSSRSTSCVHQIFNSCTCDRMEKRDWWTTML